MKSYTNTNSTFSNSILIIEEGVDVNHADTVNVATKQLLENTLVLESRLGTETGHSIELSMDKSTYVMTLSLKSSSGKVLSTKTIDFPLESVVVNAEYDRETKKITLHLQNGQTLDPIDISALISGLVKDTFTIAGIAMKDNITREALIEALGTVKHAEISDAAKKILPKSQVDTTQVGAIWYE